MDYFFKNQLEDWTFKKIESNPKKFGGDLGNSLIMHEYLKEFYPDSSVLDLEPYVMSILSSVSRIKNKLLEKHPQFDYRVKFKPHNKRIADEVH